MAVEYDETDTCWHLMLTKGKTVSILKNLDAPTARQAYRVLMPHERPTTYVNIPDGCRGWSGGPYYSDVSKVDILGPDGADLDPWRDVDTLVIDLSHDAEIYGIELHR